MTDQGSYTYQTSGYCQEVCYNISMPAMGLTGGSDCYCGSQLPAEGDKVDDSQCSTGCNGYGTENCELRHRLIARTSMLTVLSRWRRQLLVRL